MQKLFPGAHFKRKGRCCFFLILIFINIAALLYPDQIAPEHTKERKKLTAVIPYNFSPIYFYNAKTGNPEGFSVDVLNSIAAMAGYDVVYIYGKPWDDIIKKVLNGEADVIPNLGITSERKKFFLFTEPVEVFYIALFVREQETSISSIVPGISIGVINDSAAEQTLEKMTSVKLVRQENLQTLLFDLLSGKVDAVAAPSGSMMKIAYDAGVEGQIKIVGKPLKEIKRGMAVRKDNAQLAEILNRNISEFTSSVEYQHIYIKWFGSKRRPLNTDRIIAAAVASILVSIIVMSFWRYRSVRKLNRELLETIDKQRILEEEKYKIEAQLIQSQKMEAVGQLAGGVAHDFNNILTAIIGHASIIQMETSADSEIADEVEQILNASHKASRLTQNLLSFSRKQLILQKHHELNELIMSLEKLIRQTLRENIDIRLDLADGNIPVFIDSVQIEQVILNLVTNASDSMPGGGIIYIETSVESINMELIHQFKTGGSPGDYAVIAVKDTGTGIPKDISDRIFEPFFTTKETGKGTGLGLTMVYNIVKKHDGFVTVNSESGFGSVFKIFLPVVVNATEGEISDTKGAARPPGGTETILLAEDNSEVMFVIGHVLEHAGYNVIRAYNGEDAVDLFMKSSDKIDLAILDLIMPKKNGKEVCADISAIRPDINVIYMSGYTDDILLKEGICESAVDYMNKPVAPNELLSRVRLVLDRKK